MKVLKRSGKLEPINMANVRKQSIPACAGLVGVSHDELEATAMVMFRDGIPSKEIQEGLIKTALYKVDVDAPNWTYVAARLKLYDMYHEVKHSYGVQNVSGQVYNAVTYRDYLKKLTTINDNGLLSYVDVIDVFDLEAIEAAIVPERDLLFNYLGIESLAKRYQISFKGKLLELPQHLFMSVAMFLAQDEKEPTQWAIKFYNMMSKLEALQGTPTLSNGRKRGGSCFSCFVGTMEDDIVSIFDGYKTQALISKGGGGIGWDWTRVRAQGGTIQNNPGAAGGPIPGLKIENDIAVWVDQLGTRKGAINISMETWHLNFGDYLDVKKNGGEEARRCKELFITASLSDEFMRRVEKEQPWTMFDPYDTPDLPDLWGEEFEKRYLEYEQGFLNGTMNFTNKPVTIKNAKDLMKKIIGYYWDIGNPFLFFKDTVNREHKNKELGIIRSANLCMEFLNPVSGDDELAVCNLGSINLSKINSTEDIERVIPILMRSLDNVIDLSAYPVPQAEATQKHRRSVGIGVAGEAHMLANMKIMYGSEEHLTLIDRIYGDIERVIQETTRALGAEKGTWCEASLDRNAYTSCIAPTSSISIIMDTSTSCEAVFERKWTEENVMGLINVTAPGLSPDNWEYYVPAYDVDQKDNVRATARRQKKIDMGISHNFYWTPGITKGIEVYETIMLAWKLKLKTTYYLRTESPKLVDEDAEVVKDNEIACFGCGG